MQLRDILSKRWGSWVTDPPTTICHWPRASSSGEALRQRVLGAFSMTPWAQLGKAERTRVKHQSICYKDLACLFTIISGALHSASINACWMNELEQFFKSMTIWNTASLMKMSICKVCNQYKTTMFCKYMCSLPDSFVSPQWNLTEDSL